VQSQAGAAAHRNAIDERALSAIILRESEIEKLASMRMALDAVEEALGEGALDSHPLGESIKKTLPHTPQNARMLRESSWC
jgi:hypothetical protein